LYREYKKVPSGVKDDNVLPSVSEIPAFLQNIRHPRKRAVSIGPQSAADAYETLAYRDKRRRDSINSNDGGYFSLSPSMSTLDSEGNLSTPGGGKPTLSNFESQMGEMEAVPTPAASRPQTPRLGAMVDGSAESKLLDELAEREMFSKLQRPRVRYDVEVVTKLIVYSGTISIPLLYFDLCGTLAKTI
jgi:dihydrosphingosine 1-phosphate phosphatase